MHSLWSGDPFAGTGVRINEAQGASVTLTLNLISAKKMPSDFREPVAKYRLPAFAATSAVGYAYRLPAQQ